jgi:hypothetical protein
MNESEMEKQALEFIKSCGLRPVDTQSVANKLNVEWNQAHRLLLSMSLDGKLTALKTCNGKFLFMPPSTINLNTAVT